MCPPNPHLCLLCGYCVSIPSHGMGATRVVWSYGWKCARWVVMPTSCTPTLCPPKPGLRHREAHFSHSIKYNRNVDLNLDLGQITLPLFSMSICSIPFTAWRWRWFFWRKYM